MSTLETLKGILVKEFKRAPDQLRAETTLTDLGIDSLDFVDLIFKIEDRFDLKVKDDVPRTLVTLGDVAAYIDELLAIQSAERKAQAGADRQS
jgi:acyl carrier protein